MPAELFNKFRSNLQDAFKQRGNVGGAGTGQDDGAGLIPVKSTKLAVLWRFIQARIGSLVDVGAIFFGIVLGYLLLRGGTAWTHRDTSYVGYVGELIINMFRCLVLPLVASSVITATASLDTELSQRVGLLGVCLIVGTNLLSSLAAVIVCLVIEPGKIASADGDVSVSTGYTMTQANRPGAASVQQRLPIDFILDIIRNLFPPNYIQTFLDSVETSIIPPMNGQAVPLDKQGELDFEVVYKQQTNQLGLTVVSVALGVAISRAGVYGHSVIAVFLTLSKFLTAILNFLQSFSPFMVISMVSSAVVQSGLSLVETFEDLGIFILVVVLAYLFSILLSTVVYLGVKRKLPLAFAYAMLPALLTAIGTTSSVITLPVTLSCLDRLGVNQRSSRFLVPAALAWSWGSTAHVGASIVFAAQFRNDTLPAWKDIWKYSFTAFAGGTGVQPVPQGVVTSLQYYIPALGLEERLVDLVGAVDWILDPLTTAMNVLGGALVATVVDDLNRIELQRLESFDKELHMVANLVRLNQALEETMEEEEGGDDVNDEESEAALGTSASGSSKTKRIKFKKRRKFRGPILGTVAVGRLLDQAITNRTSTEAPELPYWARAKPLPRGTEFVLKQQMLEKKKGGEKRQRRSWFSKSPGKSKGKMTKRKSVRPATAHPISYRHAPSTSKSKTPLRHSPAIPHKKAGRSSKSSRTSKVHASGHGNKQAVKHKLTLKGGSKKPKKGKNKSTPHSAAADASASSAHEATPGAEHDEDADDQHSGDSDPSHRKDSAQGPTQPSQES